MALIYITGAPGAGKSTLQKTLAERGYEVYDLDDSQFGGPYNKATNERTTVPPADERTPEWFTEHEWRVDIDAMEAMKAKAQSEDIIICGVAATDGQIVHLFDKILYLTLTDEVLRKRLLERSDNDFGKNEFELKDILDRKHYLDRTYADTAISIDASRSLDEVLQEIISTFS